MTARGRTPGMQVDALRRLQQALEGVTLPFDLPDTTEARASGRQPRRGPPSARRFEPGRTTSWNWFANEVRESATRPGSWRSGSILLAIVGAGWLTVLFVAAWFQIPNPPTPEWRGWPVPTLLFMTTSAIGLLLAFVAGRAGGLSARRAAKRARATAIDNIRDTTRELIIVPVQAELTVRDELVRLLKVAGADARLVSDGSPFESGQKSDR